MAADARLQTSLPGHPKTKKLGRRVGRSGVLSWIWLLLWCVDNRSNGDLDGMTAEDIELAADWDGEPGALVRALAEVGFLDGAEGCYSVHDWADHQPWAAGADFRSAKARWNAVKRHHGEAEADRQVPEYAAARGGFSTGSNAGSSEASTADSTNGSNAGSSEASTADSTNGSNAGSNAPSPSPSPSPSPYPSPSLSPVGADAPPAELTDGQVWKAGIDLLSKANMAEEQARAYLGKLTRDHGKPAVQEAVLAAVAEQPIDPRAYMRQVCLGRAKRPPSTTTSSTSVRAVGFQNEDYSHEHF